MHTPSIFVASVALLSSFACAEVERPKFYFPRQIKREVVNKQVAQPVPRQITPATPKRQLLGGDGILPFFGTGDAASSSTSSTDTGIVTVVIQSTVFAGDAAPSTTVDSSAQTTTAGSGIQFIPGGILTGPDSEPTTTADPSTATDSGIDGPGTGTDPAAATTTDPGAAATTSSGGLGDVLTSVGGDLTSALDPTTSADPAAATDSTTTTPAADPTTTAPASDPTTTAPAADPTTTAPVADPTTTGDPAPTTTQDPVSSIISDITATSTPVDTATGATTTTGPILTGTGVSSTVAPTVTPTDGTGGTNGTAPVTSTLPPGVTSTLPPGTGTSSLPLGVAPSNSTVIGTGPATVQTTPTGIITSGVGPTGTGLASTGIETAKNGTTVGILPISSATATGTSASITDNTPAKPTSLAPQTILPTGTNTATAMWVPTQITFASSPTGTGVATTTATGIPSALPKVIAPPEGVPEQPLDNTLIQVGFLYPLNYQFVVSQWRSQVQIFEFLPEGIADGLGLSRDKAIMHSLVPYDTTTTLGYITTIAMLYIPTNMVDKLRIGLHTPLSPLYQSPEGSINTLMNLINPAIDIIPGSTLAAGGATGTDGGPTGSAPSTAPGSDGIFNTNEQTQGGSQKAGKVAGVAFAAVAAAAGYGAAMFFIARRYKRKRSLHRRASSIMNPSEMRQTGSPALMAGALGGRTTPGTDRNSRGSGRTGNSARTAQISAPMMAENSLGWN